MPRSLNWSLDLDAKLERLIDFQGATIRCAAKQLGVSRSFAQRRAKLLSSRSQRNRCSEAREAAGVEPLPVGHPITWSAICSEPAPTPY